MKVLGIDTSGKNASVAVLEDGVLLAQYFLKTARTHSQVILPLCQNMLEGLELTVKDIDRFAVAAGPGSYTGLRIGISAVKALAFGLGCECSGVSTLEAIAYNFAGNDCIVCSVMKARLDIVYCALFRVSGDSVSRLTDDQMLTRKELAQLIAQYDEKIIAAGDAASDLISEAGNIRISAAPAHLNCQMAAGICMCAAGKSGQTPDEIDALYMQITKAEKDLLEKQ